MKLEVLLSIMAKPSEVEKITDSMNLSTDILVINQCDVTGHKDIKKDKRLIREYDFEERGLSKSRNEGLLRLNGDIAIFADDDEVFEDDYATKILNAFKNHPEADVIIFNEKSVGDSRTYYQNTRWKKLGKNNCLRYGSTRIAFRVESIRKNNIFMNIMLGAGTEYQSGEDSVFLFDCLKKGLKVFASPEYIATINRAESSWFKGFTEDYYLKKGGVFACLYHRGLSIFALLLSIKHARDGELGVIAKYRLIKRGAKEYRSRWAK